MAQLRYSYEALFAPILLEQAWSEMFHVYHGHVEEGVRRILHVGMEGTTRDGLKEMALMHGKDKRPAWPNSNTFDATADSGFRQARFPPRFDKRVETGMIKASIGDGWSSFTAGGEEGATGGGQPEYQSTKRTQSIVPGGETFVAI